ncbi:MULTISPECIES: SDR family NAD(P)-dependent oxidoreductase [Nocardia]|uniref:Fatty acyl-CoA reductase n=2 Tax=Nocardia TaxID=1817 RepID=A0A378X0E0_9NOCA|nr:MULTISPECIES: SDR family NAD(P)-dependent oxidoreductase [Nocardia]MCC3311678.1 SDR family NAD(P)-dependent oxidoreductase [Nocardia africana]MDR7168447.1 short-subunit dehydrogenase [Nocardia kruczakiae]SUA47056.1 Fatty acyl-CoA reductase [Nocardia africana]
MKNFAGKTAVITGAGAGIGRALALELAGHGARLALSGRNIDNVAETAALCEKKGAHARAYRLDVTDRDAVYAHADQVAGDFGGVNIVVNNAGVSLTASTEEVSWDDFEWIVNINFWGVAYGTKAFLPHVIASGDGAIVNVSSMFGLAACPTQGAYNATKFAIRGFTDALRQEMKIAGHNVAVSCVHPGMIQTEIAWKARAGATRDRDALAANFDRLAKTSPEQAAKAIVDGIRKDKAKVLIGNDARMIDLLPRIFGSGYQKILTAQMRNEVSK